ncbi:MULTISPECIES: toll/interleukin-1 receptor domain-containing protein [unclassified Commensalibacter]|uniref:toll/interleukin-1 receptor domain-containing protein n=1 Tax=unclassified Commensalibacter TaxID=2630218 RepID=UPI0018DC247B|nr:MULTISPECIES: toll/interleukin-1 receptor domain-containing protein [unclassified Commensalibacter]MBI0016392.1 toll/interleukin-1 receptor domain-containing protein [Commensalibacter sp. B14384M2]MBI0049266.1 toll/interleukin-1 receptor domain-containing protein [Commensalibacter sp. B14384M3]MBI0178922.1 toll/interleukin-1 receptor domain-containing protein [Commensalibacter sp. W8163]
MYKSFYVENFDNYSNESFINLNDYSDKRKKINEYLGDFVKDINNNKATISGDDIIEKFFPENKYDIFLSYAHSDNNKVINLANFLEKEYEYKVFVDSILWGNIYELLKEIDKICCLNSVGNYDYDKRNFTTSNLFLILSAALHRMIEKSDYFFFLETKQSINENKKLISPWIYSELSFATQVKRGDEPENKLFEKATFNIENLNEGRPITEFVYSIPSLDYILPYEEFSKLLT